MQPPSRSPSEIEIICEEAAAFRRLSPADRIAAIRDVIAAGMAILERSPYRDEMRRLHDAEEAEWQRIQKELFAAYAHSLPDQRAEK